MGIKLILDILASSMTIVSLFLTSKYNWAWLLYCLACIFYIATVGIAGLVGLTIMGIILFFVGLKNYVVGRKKIEGE